MADQKFDASKLGTPDQVIPAARREGHEAGVAVLFDAEKRQNYHLDASGQRQYHGVPEGFRFAKDGALVAKGEAAEQQTPAVPGTDAGAPTA